MLNRHRQDIAAVWAERTASAAPDSFQSIFDRLESFISAMVESLLTGSCVPLEKQTAQYLSCCSASGMDSGDVILGLFELREAALHVILCSYPEETELIVECVTQLDRCIHPIIASYSRRDAALRQNVRQMAIVEERERLAREMHDDLSQVLGTINWRMATLERLLSRGDIEQARAAVGEIKCIAKHGYAEVREALVAMRSASNLLTDFIPALEQYLEHYRARTGLKVELTVDMPSSFPDLPVEVRLQVIRIVQEALKNVQKHAGASCVWLTIREEGEAVGFCITDNGRGFCKSQLNHNNLDHFGLSIMRERASSVGGALAVETFPGKGTSVILRLPL